MRTETRTVQIGEWLGPVDWTYDFASHDWYHGGSTNPFFVERGIKHLRTLEEGIARGETWEATSDGGMPRFGWGRVTAIGMYDGWPYWRPVPSIHIAGMFGGNPESFLSIVEIRRKEAARVSGSGNPQT